jgi:branched-chain amino acid transport system ATP-binding protein
MSDASLLTCNGLEAGYGRSQVLFGIDIDIAAGETLALLGRNGMGKSTTIKVVTGVLRPTGGAVAFAGRALAGMRPDAVARLGIALVPEGRQCFPNLTVREHLVAFAGNRHGIAAPWTLDRLFTLFPRLQERAQNLGHQLSGGEQQMLAIARALSTNPKLLILDEATEGLAPVIRDEIWTCLTALRATGQTTLIVDKYVERLIEIADRHVILQRGTVVWRGTSNDLAASRELWPLYLGV